MQTFSEGPDPGQPTGTEGPGAEVPDPSRPDPAIVDRLVDQWRQAGWTE